MNFIIFEIKQTDYLSVLKHNLKLELECVILQIKMTNLLMIIFKTLCRELYCEKYRLSEEFESEISFNPYGYIINLILKACDINSCA